MLNKDTFKKGNTPMKEKIERADKAAKHLLSTGYSPFAVAMILSEGLKIFVDDYNEDKEEFEKYFTKENKYLLDYIRVIANA